MKLSKTNIHQAENESYWVIAISKKGDPSPIDTLLRALDGKCNLDYTKPNLDEALGIDSKLELAHKMATLSGEFVLRDSKIVDLAKSIRDRLSAEEMLYVVTTYLLQVVNKVSDNITKLN